MNAFTIPAKNCMAGARAPVHPLNDIGKHLRHQTITGAKQIQIDADRRRAMQKPSQI